MCSIKQLPSNIAQIGQFYITQQVGVPKNQLFIKILSILLEYKAKHKLFFSWNLVISIL